MTQSKITLKLLQFLVLVQFAALMVINFTKSYELLDFDAALAIRHAIEMWKNGIFLQDYNYFSTIEIDNAAFLGAPIYMITRNLNLALGVGHLLTYGCTICILYDIFQNLNASKENFFLAVLFLYTPYVTGQSSWNNMFFLSVGQYEFRIITFLLLIDLMLICDLKKYKRFHFLIIASAYLGISFWTAISSGNYVLFMIVSPFVLKVLVDMLLLEKIELNTRKTKTLIIAVIAAFIGWQIHNHFAGISHRNELPLISAQDFFLNLGNCIAGIYLLFGGLTRDPSYSIFSIHGIWTLLRFAFISGLFFLVFKELFFIKRNKKLSSYFSVFAFVNLSVLLLTNSNYGSLVFEERYHILWCVMLLLLASVLITQPYFYETAWIKNCATYGALLTIIMLNLLGFAELLRLKNTKDYEISILNKANQVNVHSIYLYNDYPTAAILRLLDLECYCISINEDLSLNTGNFYAHYGESEMAGDKNILICNNEDFYSLPGHMVSCYQLIDTVEEQNIYYSDSNPWAQKY